jgi:GNAT superfamily N-acetyltransferase
MQIEALTKDRIGAVQRFLGDLSELDRTFIKEDLSAAAEASRLNEDRVGRRWIAVDEDGAVIGLAAVLPLPGWSSHVGDLRLVVHPARRGQGVGRSLARYALQQALRQGFLKIVVEVVAAQDSAISMFSALGFDVEALLYDHIRDRQGRLQDVVILAHHVADQHSAIATVGVDTDLHQP